MGSAISIYAHGPDEDIASKALVSTLIAAGYDIIDYRYNSQENYVKIDRFGTYKFTFTVILSARRTHVECVRANILLDIPYMSF